MGVSLPKKDFAPKRIIAPSSPYNFEWSISGDNKSASPGILIFFNSYF